jgi:hypothetical protein
MPIPQLDTGTIVGIAGIVITVIIAVLGWFFQEPIKIKARYYWIRITNKIFRFKLISVSNYPTNDLQWFDYSIYSLLRERCPTYDFSLNSIKPESMNIIPNTLGTKIIFSLDSVEELLSEEESDSPQVSEFKISIKLDNYLKLGINNLDELEDYIQIFKEIKIITEEHCFPNRPSEIKSFFICDVFRDFNTITKLPYITSDLEMAKISFKKKDIGIVLQRPDYLIRLIKRYIAY